MRNSDQRRRVVITGMGVISASGQDLEVFWSNVCAGRSGAVPISRFDTTGLATRIAAEIQDFDPGKYMAAKKARRFDLAIQYGLAAAVAAVRDAKMEPAKLDPDRLGIVEATSIGGMESTLKAHLAYLRHGQKGMSPFTFLNAYCGGGSGEIALELGLRGHAITYCSGSASGTDAMGYAWRMIESDEVDVMVAGGSEAPLLEGFWQGFCLAKVMSRRNEDPASAMRPFDRDRDGCILGEGAAFVVMEELAHALGRGAKIYAEVAGHGRSCEAYHSLLPNPEGTGATRAMEKALRHAGLHSSEVDYINAHGTATESNDLVETVAIKKLFGSGANRLAVSSTKPVTGHLLGAAGAIETVICALALRNHQIPPTANCVNRAVGCDLDYVTHARAYPVRAAMNLSCGFGGKNSCLVMKQYPADQ